jgi:hypothetical protein
MSDARSQRIAKAIARTNPAAAAAYLDGAALREEIDREARPFLSAGRRVTGDGA